MYRRERKPARLLSRFMAPQIVEAGHDEAFGKGTGQTLRGMTIFLWVQRGRGKRRAGPWALFVPLYFILTSIAVHW